MATLVTADGRLLRRTTSIPLRRPWMLPAEQSVQISGDGQTISYAEIYETQPMVAAAVNKLARQLATLPLKVYRLDEKGDRVRLRDHPLEQLLRRPCPRRGAKDLKQWLSLPALIHGNGLVAKYREDPNGPPTELLPMDWRYVSAYSQPGGPVEYWETVQTGQAYPLPVEETIHVAWDTPSGALGVSPLKQLGTTVRMEDSAQRYAVASFDNGARPAGAFVLPPEARLKPEEREELREQLRLTHGGVDNAFKVALISGGAEWKPMSHSAVEAELISQRFLNREEVAMVYDVPPPLIGDLRHGTYSNVSELHKMLYVTILRPWLTLVEETLQAQLIDPEPEWDGLFCEFDLGEVLRGNRVEEMGAAVSAFTNGLMTLNEVRKVLNLPRLDDPAADRPHIPANNLQPLSETPPPDSPPLLA